MSDCCCQPETPVKRIEVDVLPPDFWRSNGGSEQPDFINDYDEAISHNGDVGIGVLDPLAKLDIGGSVIWRTTELADYPANGAVGTAAATVDTAASFKIPQVTPNVNITIPAPTYNQPGRLVIFENTGTTMLMIDNNPVLPNTGIPFIWSGTRWIPYGASAVDFWRSGTGSTLPDGVTDVTDAIIHNGDVGLGLANPTQVAARLDVNGAQVLRPVTLPNFPANAPLGTAAATVDIASVISVAQATQNITLSVPTPTNAQPGRILVLRNSGTAAFAVASTAGNQKIWPGASASLTWNGVGWMPEKQAPYVVPLVITGNTTLEAVRHQFEIVEYNGTGAITITVPAGLPVGFQCSFTQVGSGRINFAGAPGMVVNNRWGATQTAGQHAKAGLEIRAGGQAILSGDVV